MALNLVAIAASRSATPRDALPPVTDAPISAQLMEAANWIGRQMERGAFDTAAPDVHRDVLLLQYRLTAWNRGVRELEGREGAHKPIVPRASRGLIARLISWGDWVGPRSGAL